MDDVDDKDRLRGDGVDRRLLSALHECGADPRVAALARALSRVGEHGAVWLAAGGRGMGERTALLERRSARAAPARTGSLALGLLKTARPRQWVKNLLVVAAPAAAGELFSRHALAQLTLTFALFTVCAAAVY